MLDYEKKLLLVIDIKERNRVYWLKIGDPEEMAHEVNVLIDLNPNEDTKDEAEELVPRILSYGFLALQNYQTNLKQETDEDNFPSFGYIIMTAYQYTLENFIKMKPELFQGKFSAKSTLDIAG